MVIVKDYRFENEVSEIDFDLYAWLGLKDEEQFDADIESKNETDYSADGFPIEIARLEGLIKEMKAKGCTHVEMEYHCDHIGYLFNGCKIELRK